MNTRLLMCGDIVMMRKNGRKGMIKAIENGVVQVAMLSRSGRIKICIRVDQSEVRFVSRTVRP